LKAKFYCGLSLTLQQGVKYVRREAEIIYCVLNVI